MPDALPFDPDYVAGSGGATATSASATRDSETDMDQSKQEAEPDGARYGIAKPRRIVVRAKITND